MIKQIPHTASGFGAADLGLALDVAYALHPPVAGTRAPEVAATGAAARTAARARRRKANVRR
ncbi:hypothetical protein [Streptomyces sp. NPDC018693]|uniref:hypothetical protein n=1 Tax=unclassified Streptomyces TaxID=2593676 RepID=UPI0037BD60B8